MCFGCNVEWGFEIEMFKVLNKMGCYYLNCECLIDDVIVCGLSEFVFEIVDEMKGVKCKDVVDVVILKGVILNIVCVVY